ncbi:uncharacterized protein [Anoplolepis gracilipes]|uniref:uncharacterized protein n=1 Tax=Anoplolepis gracilipes TaxID=354296 RepID=UPI003BA1F534
MMDDTPRGSILDQLFDCVHSAIKQGTEQFKSACPFKKEKSRKKCTDSKLKKDEEEIDIGPPCIERRSYVLPSQICPKTVSCCYIKMQDPYAPCCCETKPQLPPCPPKCYRRPQKPICGCDLCERNIESKCCSSTLTSNLINE